MGNKIAHLQIIRYLQHFIKVYNHLKRKYMSNFIEQDWNGYKIKLRPNDSFRKQVATQELEAAVLYFNSTYIRFDIRIMRLDDKKITEDTIKYEWWLCRHNKPVDAPKDGSFFFIKPRGDGEFQFSTTRNKGKPPKSGDTIPVKYKKFVGNRKMGAIDIGRINEVDRYTIVMQFTTKSGVPSPRLEMAGFTIFDRDAVAHFCILSLFGILATAIATAIVSIILKIFGVV